MYTNGEIAANYVLETPGVDSLDMAVFWKGTPTVASTATIVANAILSKAYFLEENKLVEWPIDGGIAELVVPGQHELGLALPWAAPRRRSGSRTIRACPAARCSAASSTAR